LPEEKEESEELDNFFRKTNINFTMATNQTAGFGGAEM